MEKQEYRKINWVRFCLLLPVCIISCGLELPYGELIRLFCGAATLCFFILSGFLITQDNAPTEEKLLRAIRHTAGIALSMLVLNLAANAVYFALAGGSILRVLLTFFTSRRMLFEFFVLNIWHLPVGEAFWFIHSLLYAYIVLYFWYRLGLQKWNRLLFLVTMAVNLAVGEFAGAAHFPVLGFPYIPANFVTRALPYLLLGILLRDIRGPIDRRHIPPFVFLGLIPAGGVLTILELEGLSRAGLLVYTGHFLGNALIALGICLTVIMSEYWDSMVVQHPFSQRDGVLRWCTTFVYGVHQTLLFAFSVLLNFLPIPIAQRLGAVMFLLVLVGSLALSWLGWKIKNRSA